MRYRHLLLSLLLLSLFAPAFAQNSTQFIDQLRDPEASKRAAAAQQLGRLRDVAAVDPLCNVLRDESPLVRAQAAAALGQIGDIKAVPALLGALGDDMVTVRTQVVMALGHLKDVKAVDPLLEALNNPDSGVHAVAIEALGRIGDPKVVEPLLAYITNERKELREAAVKALSAMDNPKTLDAFLTAMQDKEPTVRQIAVGVLSRLRAPRAVAALQKAALEDADASVRAVAVNAIAALKDPAQAPTLRKALADPSPEVRRFALPALARFKDPVVLETCTAILQSTKGEDWPLKATAVTALQTLKDPQAVPLLIKVLNGEYPNTDKPQPGTGRTFLNSVVAALGYFKDPRTIQPLITAAQKPDIDIEQFARTMQRIGEPAVMPLVGELRAGLDNQRRGVGLRLIRYLRTPFVAEALLAIVNDPNDNLRQEAFYSLTATWDMPYPVSLRATGPGEPINMYKRAPQRGSWCRDPRLTAFILENANNTSRFLYYLASIGDPGAIEPLRAYLTDNNNYTRANAAYVLARLGDAKGLETLVAMAQSPDQSVNNSAWDSLRRLEEVADMTPLLPLLKDPAAKNRQAVTTILGPAGDVRTVPALIELLKTDKAPEVREFAALALGYLGDARAVEPLIAGLRDPVEWARSGAAWAAGTLGDTRALEPMRALQNPGDGRFNVRIGRAMVQLGDPAGIDILNASLRSTDTMTRAIAALSLRDIKGERIIEGINAGVEDAESWVSGSTMTTLAGIRDPAAVDGLIELLKHRNPSVRTAAARALGCIGDARAIEPLANLLNELSIDDYSYPSVALALVQLGSGLGVPSVVETLGYSGTPFYTEALVALAELRPDLANRAELRPLTASLVAALRDPDPLMQAFAARALANVGDPRGQEHLLKLLDAKQEVWALAYAARYLGDLKEPRAVPLMLNMQDKVALRARLAIIEALGVIGDKSAAAPVAALLKDNDPRIRAAAAKAVGNLGDPNAFALLTAALKDEVPMVREGAATGLGALKDPKSAAALTAFMQEEKATKVLASAESALKRLQGK